MNVMLIVKVAVVWLIAAVVVVQALAVAMYHDDEADR